MRPVGLGRCARDETAGRIRGRHRRLPRRRDARPGHGLRVPEPRVALVVRLLSSSRTTSYAQTTPRRLAVAGSMLARALAFGIRVLASTVPTRGSRSTAIAGSSMTVSRDATPRLPRPGQLRLGPHSKRDDTRHPADIETRRARDPLARSPRRAARRWRAAVEVAAARARRGARGGRASSLGRAGRRSRRTPRSRAVVEALNGALHDAFGPRDVAALRRGHARPVRRRVQGHARVSRALPIASGRRRSREPRSSASRVGPRAARPAADRRDHVRRLRRARLRSAREPARREVRAMYNRQVSVPLVVRTPMGGAPRLRPDAQPVDREAAGRGAGHRRRRHQRVPRPPRPAPRGDRRRAPRSSSSRTSSCTDGPTAGLRAATSTPSGASSRTGRIRAHVFRQRLGGGAATIATYGGMLPIALEAASELILGRASARS